MTIYVDKIQKYPKKGEWCHLFTDGYLTELFELAFKIGCRLPWLQYKPQGFPHFDLRPSLRKRAIEAGAVEASREKTAEVVNLWRSRHKATVPEVAQ